jgi:PKD repeat protein
LTSSIFVKPASMPVYSVANTCLGSEVFFLNNSDFNPVNPPESWAWTFGEGSSSELSNPSHIYNNAGMYNTSLTVTYANKCSLSSIMPLEIYYNPEAEITNTDACINDAFELNADVISQSGNIVSYNWAIGDPITQESVLQNPQITISQTGEIPITLEVESEYSCKTKITDTITVHALPHAGFSPSRTWGAVPMWIDFTNNSEDAVSYLWDFGNGEFSTDENPYYIYADSGSYNVHLLSISEFGCEDDTTILIKSVVPVLDVILYDLRATVVGNYLQTRVYIINNGTLPVENLEMLLNLGDGKIYREVITYLAPSQVLDYQFTLEVWIADGKIPEVLCVEAIAPPFEGYSDSDLTNNTICNTDVENLKVLQPYPNPATDQITCEFILSETIDVEITLINGIGEQVYKNILKDKTGYTKLNISVKDFVPGVYFLQVLAGSEKASYKVEVQ